MLNSTRLMQTNGYTINREGKYTLTIREQSTLLCLDAHHPLYFSEDSKIVLYYGKDLKRNILIVVLSHLINRCRPGVFKITVSGNTYH